MVAMHDDVWDADRGRWLPDRWEQLAAAVTEHRDRVAASVAGEVPMFGTPAWAAADDRVKAASQARHEQVVAVERGREVSRRMAADTASIASHRALMQVAAEDTAGAGRAAGVPRIAAGVLAEDVRAQRDTDADRRREQPRPWEAGYSESFTARVREQRAALDAELAATVAVAQAASRAAAGTCSTDEDTDDADAEDHRTAGEDYTDDADVDE